MIVGDMNSSSISMFMINLANNVGKTLKIAGDMAWTYIFKKIKKGAHLEKQ